MTIERRMADVESKCAVLDERTEQIKEQLSEIKSDIKDLPGKINPVINSGGNRVSSSQIQIPVNWKSIILALMTALGIGGAATGVAKSIDIDQKPAHSQTDKQAE